MKTTFKKILKKIGCSVTLLGVAVLALATVCFTETALAVDPTYSQQPITGIPLTLASGTTNYPMATAPTIDLSRSQVISISTQVGAATTGVTNVYFFAPSVDNIFYDTNTADELTFSNAVFTGTFTNNTCHLFTVGAYQSMKLATIVTVSVAGSATNWTASSGQKINSP